MDEGPQYHVSGVSVDSHIPDVDGPALLRHSALHAGDVYDAGGVDKTVDVDDPRRGDARATRSPKSARTASATRRTTPSR